MTTNTDTSPFSAAYYDSVDRRRIATLVPSGNEPPALSETDERRLLQERTEKQVSLAAKKAAVSRLERELAQVRGEVYTLGLELNEFRRLFDPVRRVPAEILQRIFQQCVVSEDRDCLDTCHSSWKVAQVSKRWRKAALGFPPLWDRVSVGLREKGSSVGGWQSTCFLLATYLSRSGSSMLDVKITSTTSLSIGNPMIPHFSLSAPRWRSLNLDILPQNFLVLLPIREFVTSLLSLEVGCSFQASSHPSLLELDPSARRIFQHATQLHTIHASSPVVKDLELPWKSVRHVRVPAHLKTGSNEPWHVYIMRQIKDAQTYHIVVSMAPQFSNSAKASNPRIKELVLECPSNSFAGSDITTALNNMTLPNLTTFRLQINTTFNGKYANLPSFLGRSQAKIRLLELSFPLSSDFAVDTLLVSYPLLQELEELIIKTCKPIEMTNLLKKLAAEPTEPFPKLKTLRLVGGSAIFIPSSLVDKLKDIRPALTIQLD
jgi:hypothetical protein